MATMRVRVSTSLYMQPPVSMPMMRSCVMVMMRMMRPSVIVMMFPSNMVMMHLLLPVRSWDMTQQPQSSQSTATMSPHAGSGETYQPTVGVLDC